ncbi:MAG: histidine kinase dimerization/phospho-acceptor domain-containing protein [Patescibacteria group bacterium]
MFTKARSRLTFWYLLIIMMVSIAFSAVIFQFLSHEVERFARAQRFRIERGLPDPRLLFERTMPPPVIDPDLVAETKSRIIYMLTIINGVILILSGGLGYILAGRTLSPIQEMLDEQSRFISDASHELKTPITAIKSMMEVELRNKNMTLVEAKEALRGGVSEMNKLQKLTQYLLELTHSEYKGKALPLTTVSFVEVAEEAKRRVLSL